MTLTMTMKKMMTMMTMITMTKRGRILALVLLGALSLARPSAGGDVPPGLSAAAPAPAAAPAVTPDRTPAGELYHGPSGTLLTKPAGWTVAEEGGSIRVEDGLGRRVTFREIPAGLRRPSAVSTMARIEKEAKKQAPDLGIAGLEQSPDGKSCRYRRRASVAGRPTDGYFYLTVRGDRAFLAGVESPSASFEQDFPTLLEVMKTAWVRLPARGAAAPSTLDTLMVAKQGEDKVSFVAVPSDWSLAGSGLALSADNSDHTMTVLTRTNASRTETETSEDYLKMVVAERGGSNVTILETSPDAEITDSLRKGGTEGAAVQYYIAYNGRSGIMKGYISMTVIPMGFGVAFGTVARPDLFDRNYPTLISMARSVQTTAEMALSRQRDLRARLLASARAGADTGDAVLDVIRAAASGGGVTAMPSTVDPATASDPRDGGGPFTPGPGMEGKGERRFVDPATLVDG